MVGKSISNRLSGGFVILFQPELRRLLIYVGQTRFFQQIFRVGTPKTITSIVDATSQLKEKGWGGLIVNSKRDWIEIL